MIPASLLAKSFLLSRSASCLTAPALVVGILYTKLPVSSMLRSMGTITTVKVSKSTLEELERLRDQLKAHSHDEAIKALLKKHRTEALREALGADRGAIRPFTEEDRGEDR